MHHLHLDIETYSSNSLKTCGVYKYVEAPDFTILLLAYSLDGGEVKVVDLVNDSMPYELLIRLTDPHTIKHAHNASFERTCLAAYLGVPMPPDQWRCTMVKAAQCGMPLSLEMVAKVLKLTEQKDSAGKALIKYFCEPCKPTIKNGGRTRNLPPAAAEPKPEQFEKDKQYKDMLEVWEKWQAFKSYCAQDVRTEMEITDKLSWYEAPEFERELWNLDQLINDRGVQIDTVLAESAIRINAEITETLLAEARAITGLGNPNSVSQLIEWLREETETEITNLRKQTLPDVLKAIDSEAAKRVITIRQQLSKSSVKKYKAMLQAVCADGRLHGMFQFCGANRTHRWAGRLVQPHNLPKTPEKKEFPDFDYAREVVRSGDAAAVLLLFPDPMYLLSQLIRTAFVAAPGMVLTPSDFSAIEARVLAWLAGEKWRLDLFNRGGKIYEESASRMYKIPIERITKDSPYRQRGKIAELALGYQGGPGALASMEISSGIPEHLRIPEDEKPKVVRMWRNENKEIVRLWYSLQDAAIECVREGRRVEVKLPFTKIIFRKEKGCMFITLPSGRDLIYPRAKIVPGLYGDAVAYEGMNDKNQWGVIDTYGGKLAENITQAVARDLLAESMMRLHREGFDLVLHVHDEAVPECEPGQVGRIGALMSEPIPWAPRLPMKAEAFETNYYKKD